MEVLESGKESGEGAAAASTVGGLLMGVTGLGILLRHSLEPCSSVGLRRVPLRDSSKVCVSSSEPAVDRVSEALRRSSSPEDMDEDVPESILLLIQRPCCFWTSTRAKSSCLARCWSRTRAEREEDRSEPDSSSEISTGIRLRIRGGFVEAGGSDPGN